MAIPIPGANQVKYLEENIAATAIRLSPTEVTDIAIALPPGIASGQRYPEGGMAAVNR